jgi:hypothetical protein
VGNLIYNGVPDDASNVLPRNLTTGAYQLLDVSDKPSPSLYEGKVLTDKTYGHATYGCMVCCDYRGAELLPAIAYVGVDEEGGIDVQGMNACGGGWVNLDGYASSWWSGDTSILTMTPRHLTGISIGSTSTNSVLTNIMYGPVRDGQTCPLSNVPVVGQGNVTPSVTISGPQNVPVTASGSGGINTTQLTATGTPSGGTYSWSSSSSAVTLQNSTGAKVTVQGASAGSSTITVQYTLNGQSGTATQSVTAQQPTSLSASPATESFSCTQMAPALACTTDEAQITYTVKDQNGNAIQFAGMPVVESFSAISNNCAGVHSTPTASSGQTLANGSFPTPDYLVMCSSSCMPANANGQPTGSCTLQVSQTWKANGLSVQTRIVTYTCLGPPTVQ